ncbi:unnamed protein product, partial [Cylicocyclus nassatus]
DNTSLRPGGLGGLRVAESAVCAPPPSECSAEFSGSQESKELLKQLSTVNRSLAATNLQVVL